MKSIPSKLRESNKKVYIGPGTVVFSHLTFQPSIFSSVPSLLLLTQATKTVLYVGVRPPPVYSVYRGKSCQESLLQKRKVNVVVLVPVFPRSFLAFPRLSSSTSFFFYYQPPASQSYQAFSVSDFLYSRRGYAQLEFRGLYFILSSIEPHYPRIDVNKKNACKARNCRARFIYPREQRAFNERCE